MRSVAYANAAGLIQAARPAAKRGPQPRARTQVEQAVLSFNPARKQHAAGPARQRTAGSGAPARVAPEVVAVGAGSQQAIVTTVAGMGYELVDVERAARGLLRVTIDRLPGRTYTHGGVADSGEFITVDDCEAVTRQLQYVLEVEGLAYARLEVSSPGLDRPLKTEADYRRFAGSAVDITLKLPFEGRKRFQGTLQPAEGAVGAEPGWNLHFLDGKTEHVLGFTLAEVREARLVPVVDFKGRKSRGETPGDSGAQQGE
jgi:ribosome maturation factor RimP